MPSLETMIARAEKMPGYYGFRPGSEEEAEIHFRFPFGPYNLSIVLFAENGACREGVVDVRFADGLIEQVARGDKRFAEALRFKRRAMSELSAPET